MSRNFNQRKRMLWILTGVLTYFLLRLALRHEWLVEQVYGGFMYPVIRRVFRYTLGLLPFPSVYIIGVLAILWLYVSAVKPMIKKTWTWKTLTFGLLSTICGVFALFYLLWGFNYARPGVLERLDLHAVALDTTSLKQEFNYATEELFSWTIKHEDEIREGITGFEPGTEDQLVAGLKKVVAPMGYTNIPQPRGRRIFPKGILMRFSTAGIYIPFSGEGHVDAGMLPVQFPFTLAHELAHGFGVTNEGECNFVAYLACKDINDPVIRYSGLLSYWRYVAWEYRRRFPEDYKQRSEKFPELLTETLIAIRENNAKYPDILPEARNMIYDSYLRSNGIEEGLVSYSMIVRMVHAHRIQQGSSFQ